MFGQIEEVKLTGKQSKTYDIGESCFYGTVKVTVHQNQVLRVALCDYKTTNEREVKAFDKNDRREMMFYLKENSTYYYADKIMNDFYE
jgi:hypothetical protein